MLLFLHLPKTAGTTLRVMLKRVYAREEIFETYAHETTEACAQAVNDLEPGTRASVRLVAGHFGYGLHSLIPGEHRYITFLREPVERVVSTYYHMRDLPGDHWQIRRRRLSLRGFLESGTTLEVDNGMTRILSGVGCAGGLGACPEDALELAQRNLTHDFDSVGLSEKFDESVVLLGRKLKWRRVPLYVRQNVGKDRPPVTAISDDDMAAVREHCTMDFRLYDFARKLHESEVAALGAAFVDDVQAYSDTLSDMSNLINGERARWQRESSAVWRLTQGPMAGLSEIRRRLGLRTRLRALLSGSTQDGRSHQAPLNR